MQPIVLMEMIMKLIMNIYVHEHNNLLFSQTSSKVKNNQLQWMSPLCGLDGRIDRGVCAGNI
jgi:hypothetical protein